MMKAEKQEPRDAENEGKKEQMEYDLDRIREMSEDEQIEAFAWALEQLTEDELDELMYRCRDLMKAVENRKKESSGKMSDARDK